MKKHTLKILFASIVCLLIIQSCNKDQQRPEDVLAGKIKTSNLSLYNSSGPDYLYNNSFVYDSIGRLKRMLTSGNIDSTGNVVWYNIEYQVNKVIVRDSLSSGVTFYLHPGTNLIDSMISYNHGLDYGGTKVIRDSSSNITRIESSRLDSNTIFRGYFVDSFLYDGNNLKSYKVTFENFGGFVSYYDMNYDMSMAKRVDNDVYGLDFNAFFIINYPIFPIFDFEILGISFGNTSVNAISSVIQRGNKTTTYNYLVNTPTFLSIDYTTTPSSNTFIKHVENTYYP